MRAPCTAALAPIAHDRSHACAHTCAWVHAHHLCAHAHAEILPDPRASCTRTHHVRMYVRAPVQTRARAQMLARARTYALYASVRVHLALACARAYVRMQVQASSGRQLAGVLAGSLAVAFFPRFVGTAHVYLGPMSGFFIYAAISNDQYMKQKGSKRNVFAIIALGWVIKLAVFAQYKHQVSSSTALTSEEAAAIKEQLEKCALDAGITSQLAETIDGGRWSPTNFEAHTQVAKRMWTGFCGSSTKISQQMVQSYASQRGGSPDKAHELMLQVFSVADTDHDGWITFPEFLRAYFLFALREDDGIREQLFFEIIDLEDSGSISHAELLHFVELLKATGGIPDQDAVVQEWFLPLPGGIRPATAKEITDDWMQRFDVNKDGSISREEFHAMAKQVDFSPAFVFAPEKLAGSDPAVPKIQDAHESKRSADEMEAIGKSKAALKSPEAVATESKMGPMDWVGVSALCIVAAQAAINAWGK